MIYYGNLDNVQTYIINCVVASKSVLVVYEAIRISEMGLCLLLVMESQPHLL